MGLYNKPMVCSTELWKYQSGQSISHDMYAPLYLNADAGDNSDPPPPSPLLSALCCEEDDDDENDEFDEDEAREVGPPGCYQ